MQISQLFAHYWFLGAGQQQLNMSIAEGSHSFGSMEDLMDYYVTLPPGVAVCEIAGGEARTTRVLCKHRIPAGRNFDLVCGVDLALPQQQRALWRYLDYTQCMIVVMTTRMRNRRIQLYLQGQQGRAWTREQEALTSACSSSQR